MEDKITLQSVVVIASKQVSCELEGDVVILNLHDGVYYGLASVGARIWQLMHAPRSVTEIAAVLMDEFEVDPEQCTGELLDILQELYSRQLIEIRNGHSS